MQLYSGSSDVSETLFFTAETEGTHVYQVSAYLVVTGTGDDVQVRILRNGSDQILTIGGEQSEYIFDVEHTILTNGDELSFTLDIDGTFSYVLQLRLVRILDELAPLE